MAEQIWAIGMQLTTEIPDDHSHTEEEMAAGILAILEAGMEAKGLSLENNGFIINLCKEMTGAIEFAHHLEAEAEEARKASPLGAEDNPHPEWFPIRGDVPEEVEGLAPGFANTQDGQVPWVVAEIAINNWNKKFTGKLPGDLPQQTIYEVAADGGLEWHQLVWGLQGMGEFPIPREFDIQPERYEE